MIRGEKIHLTADIPDRARSWRNHVGIWRWCRQNTLIDRNQHSRWLELISTDPTIKMLGIIATDGRASGHIGVCGLTSMDRLNQSAEFSLYIATKFHGMGYGKDALKTLLRHGFHDHNLNRIWGESYAGNPAISMFKSLGMTEEGVARQAYFRDGKFVDAVQVSILRSEFNV